MTAFLFPHFGWALLDSFFYWFGVAAFSSMVFSFLVLLVLWIGSFRADQRSLLDEQTLMERKAAEARRQLFRR